jgi:hypothetical protein
VAILRNGAAIFQANIDAPSTGQGLLSFRRTYELAAGDTIAIEVEQNITGGGSLNVLTTSEITISRLG